MTESPKSVNLIDSVKLAVHTIDVGTGVVPLTAPYSFSAPHININEDRDDRGSSGGASNF